MESKLHNIIKKNSNRVNINYGQGEDIWDSVISFIKNVIESSEPNKPETFKSVFINHLGTFYPNIKHINKLKELENEKNRETKGLVKIHEENEPDLSVDTIGS